MIPSNPTRFYLRQDDRSLQDNLPHFVENFDRFQSSRDGRNFNHQKKEKILNFERLTPEQIQSMEKKELIQQIFRMNYRQVDRFFRKEYLQDLSQRSEEELKALILQTDEQELLLIH